MFDFYWDMLIANVAPDIRATALRAYMFSAIWPGVYRVGLRRWLCERK